MLSNQANRTRWFQEKKYQKRDGLNIFARARELSHSSVYPPNVVVPLLFGVPWVLLL